MKELNELLKALKEHAIEKHSWSTVEADELEALSEVTAQAIYQMTRCTAIVYRRVECANCVTGMITSMYGGWLSEQRREKYPTKESLFENIDDFMRDLVIWTKEHAERIFKEQPCTGEEK